MPYDPFDFDDGDGYALVPVDQAWPQVPLMQACPEALEGTPT